MRQSHKHSTLCTVVVDGYRSHHEKPASPIEQPEHHWRLPNTDPHNEGKYLFRLHTLDIYFWTAKDANNFVAFARKKLEADQLDIVDVPPTPASHEQVMSPVVQTLENVAIQDPAYHNGQTRNSRTESAGVKSPLNMGSREETRQGTPKAQIPTAFQPQDTPKAQTPTMFQPLAYNPAAPPAPEPIKHREKTPPPIDAEVGTGLAAAALRDHSQAASPHSSMSRPPYSHPQSSGLFSPQPAQSHTPSLVSSPHPSANYANPQSSTGYRASNVSSLPPPPPKSGRGSVSPYTPTPSFAPPPQSPSNAASAHSQQVVPAFSAPPQDSMAPFYGKDSAPLQSPATEILGDSYVAGNRQPLQHLHPQYADYTPPGHEPPVGGYSSYQYSQQQEQQQQHHHHQRNEGNEYDVHSQVYRPTEEEAHGRKPSKPSKQSQGRLEQGVENVDKKVNRFFKKLEKKIG